MVIEDALDEKSKGSSLTRKPLSNLSKMFKTPTK